MYKYKLITEDAITDTASTNLTKIKSIITLHKHDSNVKAIVNNHLKGKKFSELDPKVDFVIINQMYNKLKDK